MSEAGLKRICFVLNIRPERVDEYRAEHQAVWPEMQAALAETGWRDYTLFLRRDGLLVGYLVTDDFAKAKSAMKDLPVNARWQDHMAPFFAQLEGHADDGMEPLDEVFHLD